MSKYLSFFCRDRKDTEAMANNDRTKPVVCELNSDLLEDGHHIIYLFWCDETLEKMYHGLRSAKTDYIYLKRKTEEVICKSSCKHALESCNRQP